MSYGFGHLAQYLCAGWLLGRSATLEGLAHRVAPKVQCRRCEVGYSALVRMGDGLCDLCVRKEATGDTGEAEASGEASPGAMRILSKQLRVFECPGALELGPVARRTLTRSADALRDAAEEIDRLREQLDLAEERIAMQSESERRAAALHAAEIDKLAELHGEVEKIAADQAREACCKFLDGEGFRGAAAEIRARGLR